jgi:hypothetical protein
MAKNLSYFYFLNCLFAECCGAFSEGSGSSKNNPLIWPIVIFQVVFWINVIAPFSKES